MQEMHSSIARMEILVESIKVCNNNRACGNEEGHEHNCFSHDHAHGRPNIEGECSNKEHDNVILEGPDDVR